MAILNTFTFQNIYSKTHLYKLDYILTHG